MWGLKHWVTSCSVVYIHKELQQQVSWSQPGHDYWARRRGKVKVFEYRARTLSLWLQLLSEYFVTPVSVLVLQYRIAILLATETKERQSFNDLLWSPWWTLEELQALVLEWWLHLSGAGWCWRSPPPPHQSAAMSACKKDAMAATRTLVSRCQGAYSDISETKFLLFEFIAQARVPQCDGMLGSLILAYWFIGRRMDSHQSVSVH